MDGPDPIDPYDEADFAIRKLYEKAERLEKENAALRAQLARVEDVRNELKPDFIDIMRLVGKGMNTYMIKHPDWWKRIDRTPIPNDLAVNITEAICKELRRKAKEGE